MAEKGEAAYYLALRRKAAERSRKRRAKTGEPLNRTSLCSRCGRVFTGAACPGCSPSVPRPA